MINFVTGQQRSHRSGGFAALSAAVLDAAEQTGDVHYIGPINPPIVPSQKLLSKALRTFGQQGRFFFFSEQRLDKIAREVAEQAGAADLDLYHGFTPWIRTPVSRPYVALSDCNFRDYIDIYHDRRQFSVRDLHRIEQEEAVWLKAARLVMFTSEWASRRAIDAYGLDPSRVRCIGIFGEIAAPDRDAYRGGRNFAFVSTNFQAKGGDVLLAAFRDLRKRRQDVTLTIVGDAPSFLASDEGVEVAGYLRKENPADLSRLQGIFATARAIVHPTRSDISPHLIPEAGYFGCPVISSRRFAIPELIEDKVSGVLLDDPSNKDEVLAAMDRMLDDEETYLGLRAAAWARSRASQSRAAFDARVKACLTEALS